MRVMNWLAIVLMVTLAFGCKGGGKLVVGEIEGPSSIDENTSADYSVTANGDTGIWYSWAVDPPSAGAFTNQTSSTTTFNAAKVIGDTQIKIQVVVGSGKSNPVFKSLDVTVIDVVPGGNHPPLAAAHTEPSVINPGGSVQFYDDSTDPDGDDDIVKWEWDFAYDPDDGFQSESEEQEPIAEYAELGTYLVQLRVADSGDLSDMLDEPLEITVQLQPVPPVAKAAAEPLVQDVGESVHFYDDGSYDPDGGDIVKHEWDWDADGVYDEEGSDVEHVWGEPGIYAVQFRVTDDEEQTDVLDEPLEVTIFAPPVALAAAEPMIQYAGKPVHFFDDGSYDPDGGTIVKYEWDWDGDGMYEEEGADTYHTWDEVGTYYVQFRVTDDEGEVGILEEPLTIAIEETGWARTWGGDDNDYAWDIAVDVSGNVYVIGTFFSDSVDFDPGPSVDPLYQNDGWVYLSRFRPSGTFEWALNWNKSWPPEFARAIAIDGLGNVHAGYERLEEGPYVDWWTVTALLRGLDSNGSDLWETAWPCGSGVSHLDWGLSECTVDGSANTYFVGSSEGGGGSDAYVVKLDSTGSFVWSLVWGEDGRDAAKGIAVSNSGEIYVTGFFSATADFDPGPNADIHGANGETDVFLSKFDSGGTFQWARTWGGVHSDLGVGVAVDGSGIVCVVGHFEDVVDFDPSSGEQNRASNGEYDVFLSWFDSSGSFQRVQTWGGAEDDQATAVAVCATGDVYLVGRFEHMADFDPGTATDLHESAGGYDAYLSSFSSSGTFQWARTWGQDMYDQPWGVALDGCGNVYVCGHYSGTVDFNPGLDEETHESNGWGDAFLVKFLPNGYWE